MFKFKIMIIDFLTTYLIIVCKHILSINLHHNNHKNRPSSDHLLTLLRKSKLPNCQSFRHQYHRIIALKDARSVALSSLYHAFRT